MANATSKIAVLCEEKRVILHHQEYSRNGNSTAAIIMLEQRYSYYYESLFIHKKFFLIEKFDETITELKDNGLIGYFIDQFLDPARYLKPKAPDIEPTILTLDQLSIGFYACLVPMAMAVIAFILERALKMYCNFLHN